MPSVGAAPRAAVPVSNARAEASRRNGAKSRGPKTPEGRARASRNALKHGLCAIKHLVLPDEDAAAFVALEKALLEELAPEGALQAVLARQIVSATWRLARVDRMETEMLIFRDRGESDLGLAVTRDANTARALPTMVRYRAAAHAELLRSLKALQAEQARAAAAEPAAPEPERRRAGTAAPPAARGGDNGRRREPNEPEARGKLARPEPAPSGAPEPSPASPTRLRPNEPEVFAASLAHLQPGPDEAMRVAGRRGMRLHQCDATSGVRPAGAGGG